MSKTSDYIKTKIKMPNPSLKPPVSFKAPKQNLKDMDALGTFKINIESQNSKMCVTIPSQEPPASFKAQNEELKVMDILCTFKMEIEG